VDARGQPRSLKTDNSELTRNLIKRGVAQVDPGDTEQGKPATGGSLLIDPHTHRLVRPRTALEETSVLDLFAVGAMTRGQIIDSSMAHGLARSTKVVADLIMQRVLDSSSLD
jgi:hypothetical protein